MLTTSGLRRLARPSFLGARSTLLGSGAEWCSCSALAVEFQEAGEDFVAEVVGPAVAPGLLAAAASGLVSSSSS